MDQNNVKFKYIFDPAYNPKYANGAFGNITPHGEVALNFYFKEAHCRMSRNLHLMKMACWASA